ncbi:MAG: prepilin peptidase [Pseudomonadota bacterium]
MMYLHYGLLIALAIGLLIAAFTDIRSRKIANWLNGAIALGAPVFWFASGMAVWPDMAMQFGFALLVSGAWIGLYALGLLGGGDIKLLAALSLWITPLNYMTLLIIMAMVGGLMAIAFVVRRVVFKPDTPGQLPYGVAIAAGALWVLTIDNFDTLSRATVSG